MLIFLDETGADRRNAMRRYGYSVRGKPAISHEFFARGEHVSAIAIMSSRGLLDVKMVEGCVNGDEFYAFVHTHLLPHLQLFNGRNPHSVIILDNAPIHHVSEAVKAIEDVGALVHFLPPYSPDLNPIEELFSKVKSLMKSSEELNDIKTNILNAFAMITEDDCKNWISGCKIYGTPQ